MNDNLGNDTGDSRFLKKKKLDSSKKNTENSTKKHSDWMFWEVKSTREHKTLFRSQEMEAMIFLKRKMLDFNKEPSSFYWFLSGSSQRKKPQRLFRSDHVLNDIWACFEWHSDLSEKPKANSNWNYLEENTDKDKRWKLSLFSHLEKLKKSLKSHSV